ncbi:MAG: hypothetical protein P857_761 [Candidatus Xenolissoclinum pacificiensis L6]|uniref:Uncharacterized protein n=1 Tax=Candidatus Xenolissoclinum pacificiensis L6 TaxID=1401685 RepID=W2UYT2_9RICK|nr:MAG: hypothetical protein P857_761 [Candidatus Xenolissoclinum pacificiensis L6]
MFTLPILSISALYYSTDNTLCVIIINDRFFTLNIFHGDISTKVLL